MNNFSKKLFAIILTYAFLNAANGIEQLEKLSWVCKNEDLNLKNANDHCDLYLINNNGERKLVLAGDRELMDHSTFHDRDNNLMEIITGCGSNCTISTFYNFHTQELSDAIYDVLATDSKNQKVITVDENGVILSSIFNKKNKDIVLIKTQDLSSRTAVMTDPIKKVTIEEGKIYISYYDKNEKKQIKTFFSN